MFEIKEFLTYFVYSDTAVILAKLLLSALIGTLVGYEREAHGQAAGLRTNILVCMASCLLMLLSIHMAEIYINLTDESIVRADPGRIASYAVAGMGFLGAGAIIKGKGSVRGLTTAASLWLVTAIGLAIGAGLFVPAVITTVVSVIILYNLRLLKPDIKHDRHTLLSVKCCCEKRPLKEIKAILAEVNSLKIEFLNYYEDRLEQITTYKFRILSKDDINWSNIVGKILEIDSVLEISWEEAGVP